MDDTELVIVGLIVGISLIVALASLLDRRVKSKGNLFSGTPTRRQRILAFLTGSLFASVVLTRYATSGRVFIVLSVLTGVCFAYSFGATTFLQSLNRPRK